MEAERHPQELARSDVVEKLIVLLVMVVVRHWVMPTLAAPRPPLLHVNLGANKKLVLVKLVQALCVASVPTKDYFREADYS